jgi:hypothetical protein
VPVGRPCPTTGVEPGSGQGCRWEPQSDRSTGRAAGEHNLREGGRGQHRPSHKREPLPSSQGMIGYALPEIRRLLTDLIQRHLPTRDTPWPGRTGSENGGTKPRSATTADAAIRSHKCRYIITEGL